MDFKGLVKNQRLFFDTGKTKEINFRINSLKKIRESIIEYETEINLALKADLGKPEFDSYTTEIGFILREISTALKNLKSWTKPKKVKNQIFNFPAKNYIYPQPYGVTLIIGPWNYPFQLILAPLIASISAGNCSILKPSENAPNTSLLISKIISETFEKNYIAVIEGGVDAAQSLLKNKFDLIFFTGNSKVGRDVMKLASENLTPAILELGGKNPAIVDIDSDLENTARKIVWGKFLNAGQTCIAPDYLLLHSTIKEQFLLNLSDTIVQFYTEDPINCPDYSRIINEMHFDRLINLLKAGNIYFGGKYNRDNKFISPTIIKDVDWKSDLMYEEIFGPILPIFEFSDINKAIIKIKSLPKPLALYYFGSNNKNKKKIIDEVDFGGGCINDCLVHFVNSNLPFGGVGDSGMGQYHGKSGFDSFSYNKAILVKGSWLDLKLRYPPYRDKLKWIKKFLK